MIVVTNQMQEPVHEKEIQLQREADVDARRLPRGGVGRDDHLAKQARRPWTIHIERQHIGRPPDPEIARVESPDLTITDHGDVELAIRPSQQGERTPCDPAEARRRDPQPPLAVVDTDAQAGGRPPALVPADDRPAAPPGDARS